MASEHTLSAERVRVLIADDHKMFAEALMSSLCEDDRVDVVGLAHNGQEAIDLTAELEPDVVLMDIGMPVLDGVEATRRIRESGSNAHVLVLTGSAEPEAASRARAAGAAGFVTKDRSISELRDWFFEIAALTLAFGPPKSGSAASSS